MAPRGAGHRARSVRRLVTNPICAGISGTHSTRSAHRLWPHSQPAPFIQSRRDLARYRRVGDRARYNHRCRLVCTPQPMRGARRVCSGDARTYRVCYEPTKPSRTVPRAATKRSDAELDPAGDTVTLRNEYKACTNGLPDGPGRSGWVARAQRATTTISGRSPRPSANRPVRSVSELD